MLKPPRDAVFKLQERKRKGRKKGIASLPPLRHPNSSHKTQEAKNMMGNRKLNRKMLAQKTRRWKKTEPSSEREKTNPYA